MNRVSREIRTTALVGILLLFVFACSLMAIAAFFAGSGEGEAQEVLKLIALIAAGTAVLIASLAALSSLLIALGFGDPNQAMSMPRGSIRAFMAILLIALFDALVVWLFPQLDADPVNEAQERFAFQVLTTLRTLVVAAAAFYFGTRSVRTASEAVSGVSGPVIDEVQPCVG